MDLTRYSVDHCSFCAKRFLVFLFYMYLLVRYVFVAFANDCNYALLLLFLLLLTSTFGEKLYSVLLFVFYTACRGRHSGG